MIKRVLTLVNVQHITASVFINDDESGLYHDYEVWLERLAPHAPIDQADPEAAGPRSGRHNRTGKDACPGSRDRGLPQSSLTDAHPKRDATRMSCAYGVQFIANLAAFEGSVSVIANGRGYDTMVSDTLTLMPDTNATLFTYTGCGHMDHFFADDHFDIPEQPRSSGWPRTHSHPSLGSRCHRGTSGWLVARFGGNSGLSQEHGAAPLRNDIVHR